MSVMRGRSVALRTLAKINLDLRVLHKRPDGFHELRTIFQTISLADSIEIEYTPARSTRIELETDIPNNLIVRAAEAVLRQTKSSGKVEFHLSKRIPMGGGLGGGSSDAASVLLALPVLTGKPILFEKLLEMGAELGSDVPFFLFGGTAAGIGRGTELYPVDAPAETLAVLVTPGVHVSTPAAYQGLARASTVDPLRLTSFQSFAWQTDQYGNAVNDFEAVVFNQHPQLGSIKRKLLKLGARPALMSGSGSTLFGLFANRTARDQAARHLKQEFGDEKVHSVSLIGRRRYRSMWWRQLLPHIEGKTWPPVSRYAR
jgi:4-diphosphocytidyl-2-C-methyl-D-erythritol kinase